MSGDEYLVHARARKPGADSGEDSVSAPSLRLSEAVVYLDVICIPVLDSRKRKRAEKRTTDCGEQRRVHTNEVELEIVDYGKSVR